MNKFGAYRIIANERLIVEYHSGDINIDNFIASRKYISSVQGYNPDFNVIFDFRDANMIVDQKDIIRFIDFFKGYSQILGKRRSAYLTSKPDQLVITTLFSLEIENISIHPMSFSTLEAVVKWLNNKNIDKDILTYIINELKIHPDNMYK